MIDLVPFPFTSSYLPWHLDLPPRVPPFLRAITPVPGYLIRNPVLIVSFQDCVRKSANAHKINFKKTFKGQDHEIISKVLKEV
jgi:hypothetical protein